MPASVGKLAALISFGFCGNLSLPLLAMPMQASFSARTVSIRGALATDAEVHWYVCLCKA